MAITDTGFMSLGPPVLVTTGVNATLDGAGELVYCGFAAPKTGTIDRVGIGWKDTGSRTNATYKVGLQSAAAGQQPSGTWLNDGGGEASVVVSPTADGYLWHTLDADYDVTAGDYLYIVCTPQANYSGSDYAIVRVAGSGLGSVRYPNAGYDIGGGAVNGQGHPACAAMYDDDSVPYGFFPHHATTSFSHNSSSNPNEHGNLFTPAENMQFVGVWTVLRALATTADMRLNLYDTDETTVLSTIDIDADLIQPGGLGLGPVAMPEVELTGGSTYIIAQEAIGAGSIRAYHFLTDLDSASAVCAGTLRMVETNNPGAGWTKYNGATGQEVMGIVPVMSGIETPGAGGGDTWPYRRLKRY